MYRFKTIEEITAECGYKGHSGFNIPTPNRKESKSILFNNEMVAGFSGREITKEFYDALQVTDVLIDPFIGYWSIVREMLVEEPDIEF